MPFKIVGHVDSEGNIIPASEHDTPDLPVLPPKFDVPADDRYLTFIDVEMQTTPRKRMLVLSEYFNNLATNMAYESDLIYADEIWKRFRNMYSEPWPKWTIGRLE